MVEVHSRSRRLVALAALALLTSMLVAIPTSASADPPGDLFMSEYVEGSSFNKAIEIYNGTGAAIDMAAGLYTLELYSNGAGAPSKSVNLTGTVANGDVYVVAHESADAAILAEADLEDTPNSVINFNGDDAIVLRKDGAVVDAFGQIGVDPGSQWPGGGANDTLRRMTTVCAGDTIADDAFDASVEFDSFASDTFDGLGSHTADCGGVVEPDEPKINEFSASTTGTDVEYVEIIGSVDTDYSAYTVLEIEGDSSSNEGTVDEVIAVGSSDADGFYLAALAANDLENGTITLLLVENFIGSVGSDLDTNDDGVLDVTPWDSIADSVAVNDGGSSDLTYGGPVLGKNYDGVSSYAPGGASRIPDGFDSESATDWVRNDFDLAGIPGETGTLSEGEAVNTPGAPNEVWVAPPEACGDPFTTTYAIQGNGLTSPLVGQEHAVEGIVVGDFQNNGEVDNGDLGGFHIQDPTGDGDPATSDGLFIYGSSTDVAVGDAVRVRGLVKEYYDLTEVSATQIWVCSDGNDLPPMGEPSLPVASIDDLEPFEGMRVTFAQDLYISEYYNYGRYGEIVATTDRQFQPTAVYEPGSQDAADLAAANALSRIIIDDGRTSQNPDPAIHPNGNEFNLSNLFRGGDILTNVTGVVDYAYGDYKIQPTQGAGYTPANVRTASPADVGGNITVASFNVLNYFTTLGSRGADTPEEFTRQRDKIFSALATIDADVVGLMEIENNGDASDPSEVAVSDLVDGLNSLVGAGTYDFVNTGKIGQDAIAVAFIYKPANVSLVGDFAVLDDPAFLDPMGYGSDKNRPALAQSFMDVDTGGIFTAVVNHLKSKGSSCGAGDDDPEAGSCNLTRTMAAAELAAWLDTDPTESGDEDFLIIGDLNAYDKEDPIDVLVAAGYTDLEALYGGEYAYSYVFNGQLGYLDYAMANGALVGEVTGTTSWHINADEASLIDYDMSFKKDAQDLIYAPDAYRSSDHDPVIVGLDVCDEIAPTIEVSVTPDMLWPPNHRYVDVTATVTVDDNFDPDPTVTLVSVESNEPDNGPGDGNTVNDIVIVDDTTFKLRAERSGIGQGRFYTITYEVTDACGNSAVDSAVVYVPLMKGRM